MPRRSINGPSYRRARCSDTTGAEARRALGGPEAWGLDQASTASVRELAWNSRGAMSAEGVGAAVSRTIYARVWLKSVRRLAVWMGPRRCGAERGRLGHEVRVARQEMSVDPRDAFGDEQEVADVNSLHMRTRASWYLGISILSIMVS